MRVYSQKIYPRDIPVIFIGFFFCAYNFFESVNTEYVQIIQLVYSILFVIPFSFLVWWLNNENRVVEFQANKFNLASIIGTNIEYIDYKYILGYYSFPDGALQFIFNSTKPIFVGAKYVGCKNAHSFIKEHEINCLGKKKFDPTLYKKDLIT